MLIDIMITDNETGETVVFHDDRDHHGMTYGWESDDAAIEYEFGEGNFACDCNRGLIFHAGKTGQWNNDVDRKCGDNRFTDIKITERGTGRIIYADLPVTVLS